MVAICLGGRLPGDQLTQSQTRQNVTDRLVSCCLSERTSVSKVEEDYGERLSDERLTSGLLSGSEVKCQQSQRKQFRSGAAEVVRSEFKGSE